MTEIVFERTTREVSVRGLINDGNLVLDCRDNIDTGLDFLNHMLEQLLWRSGVNIVCRAETVDFRLRHVIAEDLGLVLGEAFLKFLGEKQEKGAAGYGSGFGLIDESLARAVLSFEGRSYLHLSFGETVFSEKTEDVLHEDLTAFLEGFVQGGRFSLHLDLIRGRDRHGHHHWEAVFRAFGTALGEALKEVPGRAARTSGVCGTPVQKTEVRRD